MRVNHKEKKLNQNRGIGQLFTRTNYTPSPVKKRVYTVYLFLLIAISLYITLTNLGIF